MAVIATVCLLAAAKVEEQENVRFFGPSYEAYLQRTGRFISFIFWPNLSGSAECSSALPERFMPDAG